jgi:hypothetical protein
MFGPRITTVFRSRFRAIWFAVSVLVGVWFTVPHGGQKVDPDEQQAAQAVAELLHDENAAPPAKHVNPWAKTP